MEKCCIAFIDILGFKEMVKNDIDKVILALRYIKLFIDSFYRIPSKRGTPDDIKVLGEPYEESEDISNLPKATMFSDSIVISKEIDNYFSFSDFIEFIAQMQFELLREGILIRGGIDVGNMHHDNTFIFGKGMVTAYLLESEVSIYPRIVISNEVVKRIEEQDNIKFEESFQPIQLNNKKFYISPSDIEFKMYNDELLYLKKDELDVIYIDYLYYGCKLIETLDEKYFELGIELLENFEKDTLSKIKS